MSNFLTTKQNAYIANVISGMSGTKAVMLAYGIKNENVAAVMASENLRKPKIQTALKPYLEHSDLSIDRVLAVLSKALNAKKAYNGKTVDDLDLQLKASDRTLDLLKLAGYL